MYGTTYHSESSSLWAEMTRVFQSAEPTTRPTLPCSSR